MAALSASALRSLAEQLVVYDADRDPERITVVRAANVGDWIAQAGVRTAAFALRAVMSSHLSEHLSLDPIALDGIAERLVQLQDDGAGRYTILVCGSELVGQEEPGSAESRARSMRAVLVAELQRALDDTMPPTERRSSPPVSVVGR